MTLEEFNRTYPNALDDAELTNLALDYETRTASLQVNMRGNPPNAPSGHEYRKGVLQLNGFYYFVIEPPDADHLWYPQRAIQFSAHPEDGETFSLFSQLKPKLTSNAFCCRLYVHDWNSFIHVAAKEAQLSWTQATVER
jgi:hypothetical protein